MLPRLHSTVWDSPPALSKNDQPNKPACRRRSAAFPARPSFPWPGACSGPVRWLSSIVCRCRQGCSRRSVGRISRSDRGYYWRISAELASVLFCPPASSAESTPALVPLLPIGPPSAASDSRPLFPPACLVPAARPACGSALTPQRHENSRQCSRTCRPTNRPLWPRSPQVGSALSYTHPLPQPPAAGLRLLAGCF